MSEMGYIVGSVHTGKDFDNSIANNEIFGLDGYWQREYEHLAVGKKHSESQQDAVDGSRSADCGHEIKIVGHGHHHGAYIYPLVIRKDCGILYVLHQLLHQTGTHTTHEIEGEEALGTPHILEHTPEHPHRKHIEEDVLEIGVKEHIGDELAGIEIGRLEEVKTEEVVHIYAIFACHDHSEEAEHVYNQ